MASGEDLEARRALLSPAKRALLEKRLSGASGDRAPLETIEKRPASGAIPCSFAQERLWFLQQLDPQSVAYSEVAVYRIEGTLNTAALTWALREVVTRHEVLRSTYRAMGPELLQSIRPVEEACTDVSFVDLRHLAAEERERHATERIHREARQPFDLSVGPLMRTTLLQIWDAEFILVQVMHHIVSDGWSVGLLIKEVAVLYRSFCAGRKTPLAPLPIQYADYAHWQRRWIQETLTRDLDYWKGQLNGIPTLLDLPTDHRRSAVFSGRGRQHRLTFSSKLGRDLKKLCREQGVTFFMLALAAFQVLLHRYSGQEDIVIGVPIAGRPRPELEQLVGFFVNTLALRTIVTGDLTFLELLKRVRELALGAFAHQDLPFERLVDALQPARSLSHTPLFQVMFSLENFPDVIEELPDLRVSRIDLESGTAKFDLTLVLKETPSGLCGTMEYNSDLFEPATIARMGAHFQNLLAAIAAGPEKRVADLGMLSPAELNQLTVEWATSGPFHGPVQAPVHTAFELQAKCTPDAVALEHEGAIVTYRELNRRTDEYARHLRRLGAGPEKRVVVTDGRSIHAVVALLASLKVGAVYVPVARSTPRERLTLLLEEAQPAVVAEPEWGCASGHEAAGDETAAPSPDQPAYLIFTSGSTGRPHGVLVSYEALARHCANIVEAYGLTSADRVLYFGSSAFDTSLEQILPPLTAGACVVLRPDEPPEPQRFPGQMEGLGITVADLPTTFWRAVGEEWGTGRTTSRWPSLRLMIVGGEAMLCDDLALWESTPAASARLLNAYGPTEATITATLFEVPRGLSGTTVPIGRPLPGRSVFILDCRGNPVPMGVSGELHLGGDGLAIGYLNQPELTARKFVRSAWGRLYRTGDMARYRHDGTIEFRGRTDDEVKIRGFRVAPGEIEAALKRHIAVREAAVIMQGAGAESRLIAYVAPAAEAHLTAADLRFYLRERLPDYMIPAVFVVMGEMPFTSGGKIDRRSLPAHVQNERHTPPAFARNHVEACLGIVWSDALRISDPGIHDNFFDLGGHSLLAAQVINRAREIFWPDIPVRWLFETPTIAGLAARIQARPGKQSPLPIRLSRRTSPIPLSIAQEEFWAADHAAPGVPCFNIHSAIKLSGTVDEAALATSFGKLLARHEALRTTFNVIDGRPWQVVNPPQPLQLEVFDLTAFPAQERDDALAFLVADFAGHRFDLANGPLLRAGLACLGSSEYVLFLTVHHIIADGWSMEVIAHEFEFLYRACVEHREPAMACLPAQYADFVLWQRHAVSSGSLDAQLTYWKTRLAGELAPLRLPRDRGRTQPRTFRYGRESLVLSEELEQRLMAAGRRMGATRFVVMLAAFKALLLDLTGQTDIRVGTIAANRNATEWESVVGLFINTLVLRSDLSGNPTFEELLARVRRVVLEAFDHQEIPFETVARALRAENPDQMASLFQVLFIFEAERLRLTGIPGVEIVGEVSAAGESEVQLSTFDWIVEVRREPTEFTVLLKYNADWYDPGTVRSVLERFRGLLEAVAGNPCLRLSHLASIRT